MTMLLNQEVHKDTEVMANRPDIIRKKTCLLIDAAIPAERNSMQKEADNTI
jgi:hypothetical protein